MAIWPFNRKKKDKSDLPKEVQDYYQAEKRERVGVAGLLALATLLVTVLLAMGLFFGGRWAYRAIFNNNDQPQEIAQKDEQDQEGEQKADDQQQGSADQNNDNEDSEQPPAQNPTPTPSPSTPAPSNNNTGGIPSTGTTDDLPDTGPANTAAVILGATIISGGLYYVVRRPQE